MLDLSQLSDLQKSWFEAYTTISRFNATDAARRAGYATPEVDGFRCKQALAEVIDAWWEANSMPKTEVAARMAQVARGVPAQYWVETNVAVVGRGDEPPEVVRGYALDVDALTADGLGYLIKSVKNTANGQNFELHDSQVALDKMARFHGMYQDRTDVTTNGESLNAQDAKHAATIAAIEAMRAKPVEKAE